MSTQKTEPMPDFAFRVMCLLLSLRDRFMKPKKILEKVGSQHSESSRFEA